MLDRSRLAWRGADECANHAAEDWAHPPVVLDWRRSPGWIRGDQGRVCPAESSQSSHDQLPFEVGEDHGPGLPLVCRFDCDPVTRAHADPGHGVVDGDDEQCWVRKELLRDEGRHRSGGAFGIGRLDSLGHWTKGDDWEPVLALVDELDASRVAGLEPYETTFFKAFEVVGYCLAASVSVEFPEFFSGRGVAVEGDELPDGAAVVKERRARSLLQQRPDRGLASLGRTVQTPGRMDDCSRLGSTLRARSSCFQAEDTSC